MRRASSPTVTRSSIWNGSGAAGLRTSRLADDDLDLARGQVGVGVALGALAHLPGDLDAELVAHVVGTALGEHLVTRDDLGDTRGVAQVEEGDPAVVSTPRHPTGEGDGLACVVGAESAGLVSAEHGGSFRDVVPAARGPPGLSEVVSEVVSECREQVPGRWSAVGTEDQS